MMDVLQQFEVVLSQENVQSADGYDLFTVQLEAKNTKEAWDEARRLWGGKPGVCVGHVARFNKAGQMIDDQGEPVYVGDPFWLWDHQIVLTVVCDSLALQTDENRVYRDLPLAWHLF